MEQEKWYDGRLKGARGIREAGESVNAYESMFVLFTSTAYQLVDNKYSSGNEFNAEYIHTYKFHLSSGLYVLHS